MHPDRWTPAVAKEQNDKRAPLSRFDRAANRVLDFLDKPRETARKIPVETKPDSAPLYWEGDNRIRSGFSDPWAQAESERTGKPAEPTPVAARLFMSQVPSWALPGGEAPGVSNLEREILSPLSTTADVVNDVNTRLAYLRKWEADDPRTQTDDPVYEYTSPETGKTYREEDKLHYYIVPGKLKPVPGTELTEENYKQAVWAYTTDPDGMVIRTSDGSENEEAQQIGRKQIGSGYELTPDGEKKLDAWGKPIPKPVSAAGIAEPRAPWHDTSGDSAIEFGAFGVPFLPRINPDYDVGDLPTVAAEAPAWFADLNLGSAPYYVPKYRYISAAAASLPYILGYDGGSYLPTAPGFEDLGGVGIGTYRDEPLSYAQRAAGAIQPPVAAWAERAGVKPGGTMVGGLGDIVSEKLLPKAASEWIDKRRWARALKSGIGESVEEWPTAPLNQLQVEGLRDFGKDSYFNDVTGEQVYVPTTPHKRFANTMHQINEAGLSGFGMGLPLGAGVEAGGALRDRFLGVPYQPMREIPVRVPAEDIDEDIDY